MRRITDEQSEALKKSLVSKGLTNVKTYVGMRYWKPFTEEAIENIKRDRITRLVVLPLYPQFSIILCNQYNVIAVSYTHLTLPTNREV